MIINKYQIQRRVSELAHEVTQHRITRAIVVLRGAFHFASDLLREMHVDIPVNFIHVQSYEGMKKSRWVSDPIWSSIEEMETCKEEDILLIEDIADTGETLKMTVKHLHELGAHSVRTVAFLHRWSCPVLPDHVGFMLETDDFVVGYGLDLNQKGRHWREIQSA